MRALTKLTDLARSAGKWLGLSAGTSPARCTDAIVADRFARMSWTETREAAPALDRLGSELHETFDYTADLLQDVFLSAYQHDPALRPAEEMDQTRLPNRAILAQLLDAPEYEDLHKATAGDEYGAAMAVLAQADSLRQMLARAKDAQQQAEQAAEAGQSAQAATTAVADALDQASQAADADGNVPPEQAGQVQAAIDAAEQAQAAAEAAAQSAEATADKLGPALRGLARQGLAAAAEQAEADRVMMAAWGMEQDTLTRMRFADRAELAQRLRGSRLAQYVQLIGRFRQMAAAERARKVEHGHGEYVGVTLGNDLSRLIPSETANLGVPALRAQFAARYAEGQLMQFDTRGEEKAGRGAIIACIDCSSSMKGEREAWAKALALALLDQARTENRTFVGILFSSADQQAVFEFPAGEAAPIERVIEFGEHFFGGGTDFQTPLAMAAQILTTQHSADDLDKGDVVLISDGIAGVSEEWLRAWHETKHHTGFRAFGIVFDPLRGRLAELMHSLCDNARTIDDLTTPTATADMFRVI